MVKNPSPRSALRRGLRLGRLGFSLTGSYLGYQFQNLVLGDKEKENRQRQFRHKASRRLRNELASLQGPVMKLGQILSTQTHALPEEVLSELAGLQMHAPGMHPSLARARFKSSLGKYPEEVFDEFEEEPFAAASLGQVHYATTRCGKKVVVKIQYPGIRKAIENDFKLLRSATLPGRITGYAPVGILDEIQRGFLEETDYIKEAENLELFREVLKRFPYVTIPSVHRETTTDRILTMSLVPGVPAGEFLKQSVPQSIRDLIGSRLFELYHYQIRCLGLLHADHHPGNFLMLPDGQIGVVDFGCVKRLSIDGAEIVRCCVHRVWEQGQEQADHLLRLVFGSQIPLERARKMLPAFRELVAILFPFENKGTGALVDFGRSVLLESQNRTMMQALREKATNPEFAFISRTELGLYSLLHLLKARVDTMAVSRKLSQIEEASAPEKKRRDAASTLA